MEAARQCSIPHRLAREAIGLSLLAHIDECRRELAWSKGELGRALLRADPEAIRAAGRNVEDAVRQLDDRESAYADFMD